MKHILATLIAACLTCTALYTQSFWERAHGPSGLNIYSLQYSPQGTFYAFALDKRAYRSEDSGLTWTEFHGPIAGSELQNFHVGYTGKLYCTGPDYITLYRSTDHGETWTLFSSANFYTKVLTEAPDGAVIAAGYYNTIYRTYNGVSWGVYNFSTQPWAQNYKATELGWLPDGTLVATREGYPLGGAIPIFYFPPIMV